MLYEGSVAQDQPVLPAQPDLRATVCDYLYNQVILALK